MNKRLFSLLSILAIIGLVLPSGGASLAQGPTGRFDRSLLRSERPVFDGEVSLPAGARGGPLAQRAGPVSVVIELQDEPTTQTFGRMSAAGGSASQAASAAKAQLDRINQAQAALLGPLAELGATVIYRTQRVYNGIAVMIDANRLRDVQKLPSVKAVHPLIPKEFDHASSVPLIGAPQLWNPGGLDATGDGISIGIIDTGIDYLHANYGGAGGITATLYISNNTTLVGDVPGFPGVKVVGGFDFVGDSYNANPFSPTFQPIPFPDQDPMDCNGHGTHVAGTAAGYGVMTDGATYTGPYSSTLDFTGTFRIGPGVAPEASLYALRVFGCGGSTAVTDMAIEWAVDPNGDGDFSDHLDVINMSLGSNYGSAFDTTAVASDNAVLAGVIVVAASGNAGDTYYVTSSPATSGRAVSAAASVDSTDILDGFRVNPPSPIASVYPSSNAANYDWMTMTLPLTGTLVYPPSQRSGCQAFTITNTNIISGNVALLDWTHTATGANECGSATRVNNAANAGAKGVILAYDLPILDILIAGSSRIPSTITILQIGDLLKANLPLSVTLSAEYINTQAYVDNTRVDTLASFSSRGPRRGDSALKPDIAAPGQTVFSAAHGTGDEGVSFNGTSMATPHVAGSLAVLRQLYPLWTVEELKALAMNTAVHDLRSSTPVTSTIFGPGRVGAGRINVANASKAQAVAFNAGAPGVVGVSFGAPEVVGTATAVRRIRVLNKSSQAVAYDVAYNGVVDVPGVSYSLSHSSVNLPAFGFTNIVVTMTADAALMKHTRDATVSSAGPRHWISEEAGYVTLIPPGSTFAAALSGADEVPPVSTLASGTAVFTYTPSTKALSYALTTTGLVSVTAAHIHRELPGVSGGVAYPLNTPTTGSSSGTVTLSAADEALLLSGSLYVNVHTVSNPGGEIRGQILSVSGQALRVPVYAAPRPASDMGAVQSALDFGTTTVISLTGTEVDTTGGATPVFPLDEVSLVAALELQESSPDETLTTGLANNADLKYVGVTSDFRATDTITNPAGTITDTTIYFGFATHGNWTTPNEVEFDIYIDVDRDGTDDFVLFNASLGLLTTGSFDDVFASFLFDLNTRDLFFEGFLNGVSASALNTVPFNTNVMVLPVFAADLGLTDANSTFDYHVVTFSADTPSSPVESFIGIFSGVGDTSNTLTYNASDPGLDFTGGLAGVVPGSFDLDGAVIPIGYDLAAYVAAGSQGVLLLHSHNTTGNHDEALGVNVPTLFLPIVFKNFP